MKKALLLNLVLLMLAFNLPAQQGGYALKFDGTNDYVDCGAGSSFNISGTQITMEAWIYTKNINQNWQAIAGKQPAAIGIYSIIIDSDTKKPALWLRIGTTGGYIDGWDRRVVANTELEQDKWYHIAGTYDGTTAKIYINGKLDNSQSCSGNINNSGSESVPFYIGMNNNAHFNGKIDEVRIWNIARTEDEIKANMYKEIGTHTNLKAYYKMSDGTGTSLTDNSGNNNTGTLANGPSWKASGCFSGSRQALDFDGTDDYVTKPTGVLSGETNLTIEAWIFIDNSAEGIMYIAAQRDGTVNVYNGQYVFWIKEDLQIDFWDAKYIGPTDDDWDGFLNPPSPPVYATKGQWNHVAVSINGATASYFLNGKFSATEQRKGNAVSYPDDMVFSLGTSVRDGGYWFKGKIDEVRIWNTARTESEIRENMFKTLAGDETGLAAYYRMDYLDGTTLYDMTANSHNGTLTNMDGATDWVSSTAFNTWLGGESADWSTTANWSNGVPASAQSAGIFNWSSALPNVTTYLPVLPTAVSVNNFLVPSGVTAAGNVNLTATGSVFLGSDLTLSSSALNTADNLVVESGKTLTLPTGSQLTIARQLDNRGSFIMQSGSSLITNGTLTNSGTMQISRTMSESVWHMISIPVEGITANSFLSDYLQSWDEATHSWVEISDPEAELLTNTGYSLWGTPSKSDTYSFTGTLLTGDQSKAITFTEYSSDPNAFEGANLLGNPYPSSIDWDPLQATYGSNYIWDGTAYKAYSAQSGYDLGYRYIPPLQGFFILTTNPTGNFNLTNTARTHTGAANFYKSSGGKTFSNGIVLEANNGSYADQWCLVFNADASEAFELPRDARKLLSGTAGISQIWSVCPDGNLSIDIRPETETIQLGFANDQAGIYTIGISEIANITEVYLEDTKSSNFHNLQNADFEFAWNPELDNENRFKLHLNSVGIEETIIGESNILIYTANGWFFIKGAENAQVMISDLTGRVMLRQEISGEGLISIPANLHTGVYLVTVQSGMEVKTKKVFIR